jgi:hypothetical protein
MNKLLNCDICSASLGFDGHQIQSLILGGVLINGGRIYGCGLCPWEKLEPMYCFYKNCVIYF